MAVRSETYYGNNLSNVTVTYEDVEIYLPNSLPFTNSDVVTFEISVYKGQGNYSDIIDLTFIQSGTYVDLNIELTDG